MECLKASERSMLDQVLHYIIGISNATTTPKKSESDEESINSRLLWKLINRI